MIEPERRRLLSAWLPLLLWTALVWLLGSDYFSSTQTSRIIGPLIDWLLPDILPRDRADLLGWLRLTAHPTVYGVEALLAWRALRRSFPSLALGRLAPVVLGASVLLASADEIRQAGSRVRGGSPLGVGLDLLGILAAIALLIALERIRAARALPSPPEP